MTIPDPKNVRRLILDLPELLAGTEPAIDADRAKEHLDRDPELRFAVRTVGELATFMRCVPARRRRPRIHAPDLLASVETSVRYFGDAVVSLLYQNALGHVLLDADRYHEFHSHLSASPPPARDADDVAGSVERLAAAWGRDHDPVVRLCLQLAATPPGTETARRSLEACDSIRPGLGGVEYFLIYIAHRDSPTPGVAERAWRSYAIRHRGSINEGRGLLMLANIFGGSNRLTRALRLCELTERWLENDPAVILNALGFAIRSADPKSAERYAYRSHGLDGASQDLIGPLLAQEFRDVRLETQEFSERIRNSLPPRITDSWTLS